MQSSITNEFLATGIPGEFSRSTNQDARGAILNSASEALNVASVAVLDVAGNDFEVGVAADGNFAGLLSTPKAAVRATLDAQAFISNETQIEVATRGYLFVAIAKASAIGDFVYYNDTTGLLTSEAPGVTAPAGSTRLPGGLIKGLNVAGAGVAEIYFDIAGSTESPA